MTLILLVGGADTGRAPMAAALLRRQLAQHSLGWSVESAGVLGHDGAPPEVEARDTMAHMGLDIGEHRARLLDEALAASADLLVAVDSGTARVLRTRFPETAPRVRILGELSGRQRDIPDPFRMQIGAWMTYARELDELLAAALPPLREQLPYAPAKEPGPEEPRHRGTEDAGVSGSELRVATADAAPAHVALERAEAVERMARLLQLAADMPGVVDWQAARPQLEAALVAAGQPCGPQDLAGPYAAVLRAALAMLPAAPSPAQLSALREAAARLAQPVDQPALAALSAQVAALPLL